MQFRIATSPPEQKLLSAWQDCLRGSDYAAHYTAPEFLKEPYFRHRLPFAVLAIDGSRVMAVACGLIHERHATCGKPASPGVCFHPEADLALASKAIAEGLLHHVRRLADVVSVYSWQEAPGFLECRFRGLHRKDLQHSQVLDLHKGPDTLFKAFSDTRRNQIRRAVKHNVQVREMDLTRDFDEYYRIYREWCSFKDMPAQDYDIQRATLALTSNRLVLVASLEGRVLGVSVFRHCAQGVVEYAANVSRREDSNKYKHNDLLVWKAIEWSCDRGFRYFSMGGDHFFLRQFGGDLEPVFRYRRDLTPLQRHDLYDWAHAHAAKIYRRVRESIQAQTKR